MSPGKRMRIGGVAFLISALPLLGQPSVAAWDVLKRGLADTNLDKRKQAVLSVASIGPLPEVVDLMNMALRDKEIEVRQTAVAAIADAKLRQCLPNLQAALDDTGEVAFTAAKSLWEMGDRSGRKILVDVVTGELKDTTGFFEGAVRDAKSKLRNPRSLARMGAREASGALLGPFSMGIFLAEDMLKDAGAPTRALAYTLLAEECDPYSVQLMEWALRGDRNNFVRAAAAKSLGRCGNLSTIPKLMILLPESSEAVRFMAAAAIIRLTIQTGATPNAESTPVAE
jgi:HEAT repeat protein